MACEEKPVTPNEARDLCRNVTSALDRCVDRLRNGQDFYNAAGGFKNTFDAAMRFSEKIIGSLIAMVFISMILNLALASVLIWTWVKGMH